MLQQTMVHCHVMEASVNNLRSFKTHSQTSSLATTQIFYLHYNIVYLTIENQSQQEVNYKSFETKQTEFY